MRQVTIVTRQLTATTTLKYDYDRDVVVFVSYVETRINFRIFFYEVASIRNKDGNQLTRSFETS